MKQVWIGIAVCLCLSCTRMRDGQEGVVLDLTETGTDTLGFCDVFDVVGVVPLETTDECLLGYVSKVEVVDGNYYVLDGQRKAVFVFDGQGTFLRRIGIVGHGHGEYERASDFTVDRDRRRVVILCGPREVYMYDLQGRFVGKKDVSPWLVWKIASCPEGFVGSTEDATYSEGEMAYLFYAFDPEFHARGKWLGVRRDYAMSTAYFPLQKVGGKVFSFDGARNAVHVWGRTGRQREDGIRRPFRLSHARRHEKSGGIHAEHVSLRRADGRCVGRRRFGVVLFARGPSARRRVRPGRGAAYVGAVPGCLSGLVRRA